MKRVHYREANEADLAALHLIETELDRERRPDRAPQPLESYLGFARSFPLSVSEWSWLVEAKDAAPVASGACWYREGADPRAIETDVVVRAPWRRRGVAFHLLGLICDVADAEGRPLLLGWTSETAPSGEGFVRHLGARVGLVTRTSHLRIADLDWSMVASWEREGPRRAPGYWLQCVEGPYPKELYEDAVTFHEIMETAPRDDLEAGAWEMTADQVAEWEQTFFQSGRHRWTIFVREPAHSACVGGTNVQFEPWEPTTVLQGDTGIHPEHRGKGLGKWVKAAMLKKIRAECPQAQQLRTGNAYSNAPMITINDALGFRVTLTRTEWQIDAAIVRAAIGSG